MKREEFVARYVLASVGLTSTENAITHAEASWRIYENWLAKQLPQDGANTLKLKKK